MPRLAGWEIGRVPGFYHNTGAPGVATLEAGDYLKDDYYINDTGPALYVCTTAGSASTSVWAQPSAASVGVTATVWAQIQTHDTAGAAETSFTWTVVGDTDVEYRLHCRYISAGTPTWFGIQFNGDTAANYPFEATYAQSGVNANLDGTTTFARIGFANSEAGDIISSDSYFYAKSGNSANRTINTMSGTFGSTVKASIALVSGWNSAAAITSITVINGTASGFAIGSHFELWAPRAVHVVSVP